MARSRVITAAFEISCHPDATGDIQTWDEIGQLPEPRTIHAVTAIGDRLHVLGGSKTFRADTALLKIRFGRRRSTRRQLRGIYQLAAIATASWLVNGDSDRSTDRYNQP